MSRINSKAESVLVTKQKPSFFGRSEVENTKAGILYAGSLNNRGFAKHLNRLNIAINQTVTVPS